MGDVTIEMRELYEELRSIQSRLTKLKRETAFGEIENHALLSAEGKPIRLSDLFADRQDLIVIQNMGSSCAYCTLWADCLVGAAPHIESRASLALVSPDTPSQLKSFAAQRGWPYRLASSEGSEFKQALGFITAEGGYLPGVSVFQRQGEAIINVANDMFGPGDNYCAVWPLLDLLADGQDGWAPQFRY